MTFIQNGLNYVKISNHVWFSNLCVLISQYVYLSIFVAILSADGKTVKIEQLLAIIFDRALRLPILNYVVFLFVLNLVSF